MEAGSQPIVGVRAALAGTCLSVLSLGGSIAALTRLEATACTTRVGAGGSLDLSPLLIFVVAGLALLLDVRALRQGGRCARWGRIGLGAVAAACALGIWAAAESFFRAGCS